jgi:hypothetical protein
MNFIFISPNFPKSYWNFCDRLRHLGVNVLGIGDAPYYSIENQLKNSLTEYYKVGSMEDYSQMLRAVAFFEFKYGKIDWIESNNEYWLSTDARLRTDFNVTTGIGADGIANFQSKALMKKFYAKAGVPSARQMKIPVRGGFKASAGHSPEDGLFSAAKDFIKEVGYPVIVKPEVGVGAAATYKLKDEAGLKSFLETRPDAPYVMEEYVDGDIYSYDAIVDSKGEPLFENSCHFPPSIMNIVTDNLDCAYYALKEVPAQLRERGRKTVKAFGVRSRFVHMEFFCLSADKPGLGKKGDFVGLEVNMRPAGGYTPDMMDFAHSTDVYQIWAEMVVKDRKETLPGGPSHFCAYYGRRDGRQYVHSHDEVLARYGSRMVMCDRMPDALSSDLGNQMYMALLDTEEELKEFMDYLSNV